MSARNLDAVLVERRLEARLLENERQIVACNRTQQSLHDSQIFRRQQLRTLELVGEDLGRWRQVAHLHDELLRRVAFRVARRALELRVLVIAALHVSSIARRLLVCVARERPGAARRLRALSLSMSIRMLTIVAEAIAQHGHVLAVHNAQHVRRQALQNETKIRD